MKPILLFCKKSSSEHHIGFSTHENSKVFQVLLGTYIYIKKNLVSEFDKEEHLINNV
jgi:predicted aldo/keto reductase-like oxidoreductase